MITTSFEFRDLLAEVNDATKLLQRSTTVPENVIELIDSFESALGAATPSRLDADPYLTTALWSAAYRAQKALRHDNAGGWRRDERIALEQFRQALRDIVENQPYNDGAAVRDVLARRVRLAVVGVPQFAGRTISSRRTGHGAVPEPSSVRACGRNAAQQRGPRRRPGRRRVETVNGGGRRR
jgi:hypothetical protein